MQTDISPLCKALITLLASGFTFTRNEIAQVLRTFDRAEINRELDMLVRATVVIEADLFGEGNPRPHTYGYFLAGTIDPRPAPRQRPAATDADVAGITANAPISGEYKVSTKIGADGITYVAGIGVAGGEPKVQIAPTDPSGVECIQITRHRNHNVGSAIRSLWSVGVVSQAWLMAPEQIDALRLARFHIDDEIERLQLSIEQRGAA